MPSAVDLGGAKLVSARCLAAQLALSHSSERIVMASRQSKMKNRSIRFFFPFQCRSSQLMHAH